MDKIIDNKVLLRELAADAADLVRHRVDMVPPLTPEQLKALAETLLETQPQYHEYRDWALVFINNALWADVVAAVPNRRKLLLIPQCLKNDELCRAEIDEFGLLCEGCGACEISGILDFADAHGMMSMVAEGSTMVAGLIEGGEVDAMIGVSCFSALEKAFRQMVDHGVPGLALPLNGAGCKNTSIDTAFLKQIVSEKNDAEISLIHSGPILHEVKGWFASEKLERIMGPLRSKTDEIARIGLDSDGKRYRPFLFVAAARCLGVSDQNALEKLAVAVECFHKASLIHDDIEDGDEIRNDKPALQAGFGMPVALNAGDFLLGEGYRMISELETSAEIKAELLAAAVAGHLELARGQGEELLQRRHDRPISLAALKEIFRQKTSPAFNVAFQFAAIIAGGGTLEKSILAEFSDHLGIGYQIVDDLRDTAAENLLPVENVSIIPAIMREENVDFAGARDKALMILGEHKGLALASLEKLKNINLKRLLFQVAHKILKYDDN